KSAFPVAPSWFDATWYLNEYPDVAASGMNAWHHYWRYGRLEGRLPRPNRALAWTHHLYFGGGTVMLARLQELLSLDGATAEERDSARWAIASWFALQSREETVIEYLLEHLDDGLSVDNALLAESYAAAGSAPW